MWKLMLLFFCGARFLLPVASDSDALSCPQNEVYSDCSNALCRALKCEHRGLPVPCPSVSGCDKSCVCADGFLRNTKGVCVPADDCDVGPTCPENKVYSNCTNAVCRNQYCSERDQPTDCPTVDYCNTGCLCAEGYLMNDNDNCIKEELCD